MSFTIISEPQEFSPAYNALPFIVDSSNSGACSYKFVADLYINGSFVTTLFAFPEGPNDYGVFRVDRIIQDYISYDVHNNLIGFTSNVNSIVRYYLDFYEDYDTNSPCTGETTLSALLDTSNELFAWNAAIQHKEFTIFNDADYQMNIETAKFLTTAPDNVMVGIDEQFNLNFIQLLGQDVTYAKIVTYDIYNNVIGTYIINNTVTALPFAPQTYLLTFAAGPASLNSSTLSSGVQPVIGATVSYYDLNLWQGSPGTQVSETKRFKIDLNCTKFITRRLFWWNRLGAFDSYSFKLKSFRNVSIERTEYSRLLNRLDGSSYGYDISDRGRTVMSVTGRENVIYNTNWLTELEGLWLEQLFTSPEVYLKDDELDYEITGAVYRAATADLVLGVGVLLAPGTVFNYVVSNGAAIGMPASGQATITGFGTGRHQTNIPASINVGAIITGTLTVPGAMIPMVVKTATFEEKLKVNKKRIQYSIELSKANDLNIQRQ